VKESEGNWIEFEEEGKKNGEEVVEVKSTVALALARTFALTPNVNSLTSFGGH
jgi:hypothetical protein